MKKSSKTIGIIFVILLIFCIITVTNIVISKNKTKFDFNTVRDMNIGAEMVELLYADNKKVIMNGTFGIIEYDIISCSIKRCLSPKVLNEEGITNYIAVVSKNGNIICFNNIDANGNVISNIYYNTQKNRFYMKSKDISIFRTNELNYEFDKKYNLSKDNSLIISNQYVLVNNRIVYLYADNNWSMSSLTIAIFDIDSLEDSTIPVFVT